MNAQVQQFLDTLFATNTLNRLPGQYGGGRIFDSPAIGVSKGDDPIFSKFKEVVGPRHLTPEEMWVQSGLREDNHLPGDLRILSIIFPYVDRIRKESKTAREIPAER